MVWVGIKGSEIMVVTEEVNIKWNGNNKKHYISKVYDFTNIGDMFTAKIEDVLKGSEVLVEVRCDYCGGIYTKTFYKYNKHRKDNLVKDDCCIKCRKVKVKEVTQMKYGVDNVMQLEKIKEKVKDTMIEKYGVERYAQTEEWKEQFSGENSPTWNGGITSTYMKVRNSTEQKYWKLNVFKRDEFQCVACKSTKSGSLNAHHIFNFAEYKHLINDIDNGVTFCKECHKKFHQKYGYTNNNQTQLNEFLNYNQDVETIETTA